MLSILFLLFSYIKEGESLFPKKTKIEKNVNDSKELLKILKSFEIELGKLNQSKNAKMQMLLRISALS